MKLVMTVDYDSGTVTCSGPTLHYCLEGESPEVVRTEFFMALEEQVEKREAIEIEQKNKIEEITTKYNELADKTFKNRRNETSEFRTEHYMKPKWEVHKQYNWDDLCCFKLRTNKFDMSDFTTQVFLKEKRQFKINYDMVVVRSLDDWYNEYLLENQ